MLLTRTYLVCPIAWNQDGVARHDASRPVALRTWREFTRWSESQCKREKSTSPRFPCAQKPGKAAERLTVQPPANHRFDSPTTMVNRSRIRAHIWSGSLAHNHPFPSAKTRISGWPCNARRSAEWFCGELAQRCRFPTAKHRGVCATSRNNAWFIRLAMIYWRFTTPLFGTLKSSTLEIPRATDSIVRSWIREKMKDIILYTVPVLKSSLY